MATPQPDDAELPLAPPDLRRRLQPRPEADRPSSEGPRAARDRPRGRPDGSVGGPDPRPPARLHHVDLAAITPPSSRIVDPPPRRAEVSTPTNLHFFSFDFGLVIEAE